MRLERKLQKLFVDIASLGDADVPVTGEANRVPGACQVGSSMRNNAFGQSRD